MVDAVVDKGAYQDDILTLGGSQFAIFQGVPITMQSISEFSTGLKIGSFTYDQREHAFWNVFNDFSGGFGYRHVDAQDEVGRHWDNVGGVDLRRAKHVTLPAKHLTVTPDFAADLTGVLFYVQHTMVVSDVGGTEYLHIGIGDSIYTLDATRTSLVRRKVLSTAGKKINRVNRILEFKSQDGTRALYAFGYGDTGRGYYSCTDGVTWVNRTTDPNAVLHDISDAIVWDGQILAASNLSLVSSSGGAGANLTWSDGVDTVIDPTTGLASGVHWTFGGFPTFIGVTMTPWGKSSPYFIDQGDLWALDFYVHNAVRIQDLGEKLYLSDGTVWNGSIYVTNGTSIWMYTPSSGEAVHFLGPFGKDGAPPTWRDGQYNVVQFLTGVSYLFAVCRDQATFTKTRILVFTNTGWTWFGEEIGSAIDTECPYSALIDRFPVNLSLTVPSRSIDIICGSQNVASAKLHTFQLPIASEIPYVGSGATFATGPKSWETGWFDGGFMDLEGALIRFQIDGHNITDTETVLIEYRLNNDESENYQPLGTFTKRLQQMWFASDHTGIPFYTVQFRITLNRGSDQTLSPELRSLVLVFDKKPNFRAAYTVRIDLVRSVRRSFYESVPAVLDAIEDLWNVKTLLRMNIPNITSKDVNVRVSELRGSFEAVRKEASARGYLDVTLLEPIGP